MKQSERVLIPVCFTPLRATIMAAAAPALLEALPPELIKRIVTVLFETKDPDSCSAAMQTCSAMRVLCSGFISSIFIRGFDALWRFPRHAVIKVRCFPRFCNMAKACLPVLNHHF